MWSSSSEWHGQGFWAGHQRRSEDATILWFNERTARGAVGSDDGRVRSFERHELPASVNDYELSGIARRRVQLASFRFKGRGGDERSETTGDRGR